LNRRTFHCAIRAIHAAITTKGLNQILTGGALVKELASVSRHYLCLTMLTMWARYCGSKLYF
jgi:hypothetical protein